MTLQGQHKFLILSKGLPLGDSPLGVTSPPQPVCINLLRYRKSLAGWGRWFSKGSPGKLGGQAPCPEETGAEREKGSHYHGRLLLLRPLGLAKAVHYSFSLIIPISSQTPMVAKSHLFGGSE